MNDEKEISEREDLYREKFINTFARIMKSPEMVMNLTDVYSELGISHLSKKFKNKNNINEHYFASRLLVELFIHSVEEGWRYYEKGNYKMAIIFHEIAAKASEYKPSLLPYVQYELARFYALNKQKKKALKMLERAVENGFNDIKAIENQEDLISIRKAPEFKKIIKELKEKKNHKLHP
jgi:tetratricopeptide (TPR) repeat protein